ncbi:MAG: glycosyltransferase [Betaproteobacteria bacterium]|nr:glycosyltransferase [Betaproteobacteria bacterium]
MERLRVLFAVHDWGLGHATRGLVLIRALLTRGHEVTVVCAGRAAALLRQELGASCTFVELRDIPKPLSRRAFLFYIRMSLAMPAVFETFRREQRLVETLCRDRRFDRIISDSRLGVHHPVIPSYFLFHSPRQIIPGRPRALETFVERNQRALLFKARKILVPDDDEDGLAGELCHHLACDWQNRLEYIGILSRIRKQDLPQDIDTFISISGAEPQRTIFERLVLAQAPQLRGRVVITLGRPDLAPAVSDDGRLAVHSFMDRATQEAMMNRARLVVTRSGYTTVMELAELGKRALLVPTLGQSEQEYLAAYHHRLGHAYGVRQKDLRLARDVAIAERYPGLSAPRPTSVSVERFLAAIEA